MILIRMNRIGERTLQKSYCCLQRGGEGYICSKLCLGTYYLNVPLLQEATTVVPEEQEQEVI